VIHFRVLAGLLLCGCAGCSSSGSAGRLLPPPDARPDQVPNLEFGEGPANAASIPAPIASGPGAQVLGTIAGLPLTVEELLDEWHGAAGPEVLLVLDKLVATHLAYAEASRLGIELDPALVEKACAEHRSLLEQEVGGLSAGTQGGQDAVDAFLRRELGVDPARHGERIRRGTIRQMLAERCVRAWTLGAQNATVRVIAVEGEDALQSVTEALSRGESFATVAMAHSVDPSKEEGGRVPFLRRQEGSALSQLAFSLPIEGVGGPLDLAGHKVLIQATARREPLEGGWSIIGPEVERSLGEDPVAESEFIAWKLAMERRYPVDLRAVLELIGAPGA